MSLDICLPSDRCRVRDGQSPQDYRRWHVLIIYLCTVQTCPTRLSPAEKTKSSPDSDVQHRFVRQSEDQSIPLRLGSKESNQVRYTLMKREGHRTLSCCCDSLASVGEDTALEKNVREVNSGVRLRLEGMISQGVRRLLLDWRSWGSAPSSLLEALSEDLPAVVGRVTITALIIRLIIVQSRGISIVRLVRRHRGRCYTHESEQDAKAWRDSRPGHNPLSSTGICGEGAF